MTLKYMQTVKCKFGKFGLFSKMPGLIPGRMSGCVQHVAHNTSPKPTALFAKNWEVFQRLYWFFFFFA